VPFILRPTAPACVLDGQILEVVTSCGSMLLQGAVSASSRSSIYSKMRFATPSLFKGHSLSEGWSSGEADGRDSRCSPSGTSSEVAPSSQLSLQ
jgi:hypothetical protein